MGVNICITLFIVEYSKVSSFLVLGGCSGT